MNQENSKAYNLCLAVYNIYIKLGKQRNLINIFKDSLNLLTSSNTKKLRSLIVKEWIDQARVDSKLGIKIN